MSAKITLPIYSGPPPDQPPDSSWGGLGDEGWARGSTFLEFASGAGAGRVAMEAAFHDLEVPDDFVRFLAEYPNRVRILALADATDAESAATVARAERLCTLSDSLWMRIFAPAACPDLVQRYAATGEPLPRFVFFGPDRREFARWGPSRAATEDSGPQIERLEGAGIETAATKPPLPACDETATTPQPLPACDETAATPQQLPAGDETAATAQTLPAADHSAPVMQSVPVGTEVIRAFHTCLSTPRGRAPA